MRFYAMIVFAASSAAGLTRSSVARAGDPAAAEALFVQARDAMKSGNYERACPMLEESYRLNEGVGTRFNLADCYEHVGKSASAWAAFRDVAAASKLAGHKDREAVAAARASALEGKLCRLKVMSSSASAKEVSIARDGTAIGGGQLDAFLAIDPGHHVVTASREGFESWQGTIDVLGCPKDATISVPELVKKADAKVRPPSEAPTPGDPPRTSSGRPLQTALGIASFGVAAVGLGLGTYFGLDAASLRDESNSGHCQGNVCDDVGKGLRADSRSQGDLSDASFIGAGVFIALGVVLFATRPTETRAVAITGNGLRATF